MKQLKITIAGEVKTFDLPENGEYKCEVTESYAPKAGDEVWCLNAYIDPEKIIFREDCGFDKTLLEKGLLFPTEEKCQNFADHCWEFINKKNK